MQKVRFLHTSDVHLESKSPERLDALIWILEKATIIKAAVVIVGDLFSSAKDAQALRSKVSEIFTLYSKVKVFIIPGFDDKDVYVNGEWFGSNVKLLKNSPYTEINYQGVKIVGVPHQEKTSLSQVLNKISFNGLSILLIYGTLFDDSAQSVRKSIKENGENFFPFFPDDIADKNIVYVAMGHLHSGFTLIDCKGKKLCYPGSPISLGESDVGLRKVAQVEIDTDSKSVNLRECIITIGVYKVQKEFVILPGNEDKVMRSAANYLKQNRDIRADMTIELKGFTRADKNWMAKRVENLIDRDKDSFHRLKINDNTASYKQLIEGHALVQEFISRMESSCVNSDVKYRAVELGIRAFEKELS